LQQGASTPRIKKEIGFYVQNYLDLLKSNTNMLLAPRYTRLDKDAKTLLLYYYIGNAWFDKNFIFFTEKVFVQNQKYPHTRQITIQDFNFERFGANQRMISADAIKKTFLDICDSGFIYENVYPNSIRVDEVALFIPKVLDKYKPTDVFSIAEDLILMNPNITVLCFFPYLKGFCTSIGYSNK